MKVRSDSLFARLNPEQRDVLFLLLQSKSLQDGVHLCKKWGLRTSAAGLSRCYSEQYFGWKLDRARAAASMTEDLGTFDAETKRLAAQKMFEELAKTDPDPKFITMVTALELERRKVELAERSAIDKAKLETEKLRQSERRIRLLEQKSEKVKAVNNDSKLSPEEKRSRINQIFGKAP